MVVFLRVTFLKPFFAPFSSRFILFSDNLGGDFPVILSLFTLVMIGL